MFVWDQNLHQSPGSSIVYVVHPFLFDGGLNRRTLLQFDLATVEYVNTTSYNAEYNDYQERPCTTHNHVQNVLYVIGGRNETQFVLDRIEVYDIVYDTWDTVSTNTPLDNRRYDVGCAMDIDATKVFLFGGYDAMGNATADIWQFTVGAASASSWAPPSLLSATIKTATVDIECKLLLTNSLIYCIGGDGDAGVAHSDVNVFNPGDESVDYTSYALNNIRVQHVLLEHDNCLYVVGGADYNYQNPPNTWDTMEYLCINTNTSIPDAGTRATSISAIMFVALIIASLA
jgi:hypothetical protein